MNATRITLVALSSGTLAYFLAGLGITAMHAITYHHDARCECTAKAVRPCLTCHALVCATCSGTVL